MELSNKHYVSNDSNRPNITFLAVLGSWSNIDNFRGHVLVSSSCRAERLIIVIHKCSSKINKFDIVDVALFRKQHILRFEIPVDNLHLMHVSHC